MDPVNWLMTHVVWQDVPGYLGGIAIVASYMMKTMIPLRALTIVANICFIYYGYLLSQYPTLFMHALLLPLNAVRLYQMTKLIKRVRESAQGSRTLTSLKPYMKRRRVRAGDVVFHKDEVAHELHYVVSGTFRAVEIDKPLAPGTFVGELALLAPKGRRTQTVECVANGELLSISYDNAKELFFQNPDFGFHFLQLTASRLFENVANLEEQVVVLKDQLAVASASGKK